jgi:hypothetical protein
MSRHEQRFRELVRGLLAIGVKPTPTKINRFLGRTGRRKVNNINGREAAWRRQELLTAGWTEPRWITAPMALDDSDGFFTDWEPPT